MSLLRGTEGGLHGGLRQPLLCSWSQDARNIPDPRAGRDLRDKRGCSGTPPASSSPHLVSPLRSLKPAAPKTFQPLPQLPFPRPHLDLGFSRNALAHLESPFPAPRSPTPAFPHTPSVTLSLIIPCRLPSLTPFSFPSPSPYRLCLSSLRLQANVSVASTLSPLPFPSSYFLAKSWSRSSPACCLSCSGPQAVELVRGPLHLLFSIYLLQASLQLCTISLTSPLLGRPHQQATNTLECLPYLKQPPLDPTTLSPQLQRCLSDPLPGHFLVRVVLVRSLYASPPVIS